jgi:hypothetical protein
VQKLNQNHGDVFKMFIKSPFLFLVVLCFVAPSLALARPLSYPTGWMVMTENNGDENALELNYTVTPRTAFVYHTAYQRDDSSIHHAAQMNNLIWRGNFPDSQGNLYSKLGAGVNADDSDTNSLVYGGIMADWEDRRIFTSYGNEYEIIDGDGEFTHMARVGIAPYVGDVGDVHTWVMVQADHRPENKDPIEITPLVRLFKGENLMEIGYSNQHNFLFNYTRQF